MGSAAQETTTGAVSTTDRSDDLYTKIYDIAANMGSHSYLGFDLDDVFTYEEWYDCWLQNNLYWFSVSG